MPPVRHSEWTETREEMSIPYRFDVIEQLAAETGDLIQRDTTAFTDQALARLAPTDPNWGRKVRRDGDWSSRNPDALAYRTGVTHVYVDVVIASDSPDAKPSWQVTERSDGYWMALPGTPSEPPVQEPAEPGQCDCVQPILMVLGSLEERYQQLADRVTALEAAKPPTFTLGQQTIQTSSARLALSHTHTLTVPTVTEVKP